MWLLAMKWILDFDELHYKIDLMRIHIPFVVEAIGVVGKFTLSSLFLRLSNATALDSNNFIYIVVQL
jgi:hypothetical protein